MVRFLPSSWQPRQKLVRPSAEADAVSRRIEGVDWPMWSHILALPTLKVGSAPPKLSKMNIVR